MSVRVGVENEGVELNLGRLVGLDCSAALQSREAGGNCLHEVAIVRVPEVAAQSFLCGIRDLVSSPGHVRQELL